jgi:hypothetical protein
VSRQTVAIVLLICGSLALASEAPKPAPVKEPELRQELLRRTKVDQDARGRVIDWSKKHGKNGRVDVATLSARQKAEHEKLLDAVKRADRENTAWLEKVVEKQGWPTITLVGKDGANAAWLLVQHADDAPKFQRKCLDLMTRLPGDEVSRTNLAYLTDRVLLAEGKKQVYGTQFTLSGGKWKPRPIDDEANVDKRRKEAGLAPIAEYAKQLEKLYGGAPKK